MAKLIFGKPFKPPNQSVLEYPPWGDCFCNNKKGKRRGNGIPPFPSPLQIEVEFLGSVFVRPRAVCVCPRMEMRRVQKMFFLAAKYYLLRMENIKYSLKKKPFFLQNQQLFNVDACSRPMLVYQCPIKQDWVKFEHQSNITPPPANSKTLQNKVRYFEITTTSMWECH